MKEQPLVPFFFPLSFSPSHPSSFPSLPFFLSLPHSPSLFFPSLSISLSSPYLYPTPSTWSPDWHQYDDIICMKPNIRKFISNFFHPNLVVQGKQLAAGVMLGSVFGVLGTWSAANVAAFCSQMQQLFEVLRKPIVYQDKLLPWTDLQYGEKEVLTPPGSAVPLSPPSLYFSSL